MKINKTYALVFTVIFFFSCIGLAYLKHQKELEKNYLYLAQKLKSAGDAAFALNSYNLAEEYYQKSHKWSKKIKISSRQTKFTEILYSILNKPEMVKASNGFVYLDNEWHSRTEIILINTKHRILEKETLEAYTNSLIYKKDGKFEDASLSLYFVLSNILKNSWLQNQFQIEDVYRAASSIPNKHTSPLHLAVNDNEESVVKNLLYYGVNVNSQDNRAITPLQYALINDNLDIIKLLLQNGANYNILIDDVHPLAHAIKSNNVELVQILINHKVDINRRYSGIYPLMLATRFERVEILKTLLLSNSFIDTIDNMGMTPLTYAFIHQSTDCVNLLLDYGADRNQIKTIDFSKIPANYLSKTPMYREAQNISRKVHKHFANSVRRLCPPNSKGYLILTKYSILELQKLSEKADRVFPKKKQSQQETLDTIKSATIALNYLSSKMDSFDIRFMEMVQLLSAYSKRYGYKVFSVPKGYRMEVLLFDSSGQKVDYHTMVAASPFVFGEKNYLIMQIFPQLPGLEDAITSKIYNYLIHKSEITKS